MPTKDLDEWEKWYFEKAFTESKSPIKITPEILTELGERLHEKITEVVIPEWQAAFNELSLQDCKDYIYNLTINRTLMVLSEKNPLLTTGSQNFSRK